jgi:hypothetical protein
VEGVSTPVAFDANATPAPVAVKVNTQPASAQVRVVLTSAPAVELVNASGHHPAAWLPVTVSLVGGGALEGTTTQLTDAAGASSSRT